MCVCMCVCEQVWLNTADCFFLKSSSEDVQVFSLVFVCLGQVGRESTLY